MGILRDAQFYATITQRAEQLLEGKDRKGLAHIFGDMLILLSECEAALTLIEEDSVSERFKEMPELRNLQINNLARQALKNFPNPKYRHVLEFTLEKALRDLAERNGIDPKDIHRA